METRAVNGPVQPPSIRPLARRLANPRGSQKTRTIPYKLLVQFARDLRDNARAEGTLFGKAYGVLEAASELDRGPLPFCRVGGSRPGGLRLHMGLYEEGHYAKGDEA